MPHPPRSARISLKTQEALECALADEREAENVYAAIGTCQRFGAAWAGSALLDDKMTERVGSTLACSNEIGHEDCC